MRKENAITRNNRRIGRMFEAASLFLLVTAGCSNRGLQEIPSSSSGISVTINPKTGSYSIHTSLHGWDFTGSLKRPLEDVKTQSGKDSIGAYHALQFNWTSDQPYKGSIRRYDNKPIVLFVLTVPQKASHVKATFPSFQHYPDSMHHYSFENNVFSPPVFKLRQTSTPWLFFNDRGQAFIFSPASDFMVSRMIGHDTSSSISSGLNRELSDIPAGFTHKTILVLGENIHSTWTTWGDALRKMYGRKRPGNESDPILKYYGYWTDNGAYYYYNYDKNKGYGGTLRAVKEHYQKEGIPIGYMQLDSWWYEKSIYGPNGKPDAGHKNRNLPDKGSWNNYGGLLVYQADREVFPKGLTYFGRSIGLPLIVHNRWIDPHSPYRKKYKITGFAAVDPAFWNDIDSAIATAGVVDYEQDWLNVIYDHTPRMATDPSVGNAFTDNMARAAKNHGLDMQYCMAMPRYFMQGVKYNNLTTIRTSDDRFEPAKWRHFIYVSQLAYAMGIWPWSDVFMSTETGDMIASVLSSGPVGTGDKIGKEDKVNILKVARTDGILVKPDAPLLPMDEDYLNEANHIGAPMLAFTYTRQNNVRTNYVFVFAPEKSGNDGYTLTPSDANLDMRGMVILYNPLTGMLKKMSADSTFEGTLANAAVSGNLEKTGNTHGTKYKFTYFIIAPITQAGIAFLGDEGKIVSTGRQRISQLSSSPDHLQVQISFARNEHSVILHGYYDRKFKADHGSLHLNPRNNTFTLSVSAPEYAKNMTIDLTPD